MYTCNPQKRPKTLRSRVRLRIHSRKDEIVTKKIGYSPKSQDILNIHSSQGEGWVVVSSAPNPILLIPISFILETEALTKL